MISAKKEEPEILIKIKNILSFFDFLKSENKECIKAFKDNDLKVNSLMYPFYRIIPKFFQFLK
jgi:hypothetical protein